ncbi:MAG: hypothetical protein ABS938_11290 [Psychrobacillus psychrodurans]
MDPNGDALSYTISSSNPQITAIIHPNGWVELTAPVVADGQTSQITLTADDGKGGVTPIIFTATVKYY